MSGELVIGKERVIVDRALRPEDGESPEFGFETGQIDLIRDTDIEDRNRRKELLDGEGDISIILTAGEELGDFKVSVQFEGPVERHDQCLSDQGQVLQNTASWLRGVLQDFKTDWEVDLTTAPCKTGNSSKLKLPREVARTLAPERERQRQADVSPQVKAVVDVKRTL